MFQSFCSHLILALFRLCTRHHTPLCGETVRAKKKKESGGDAKTPGLSQKVVGVVDESPKSRQGSLRTASGPSSREGSATSKRYSQISVGGFVSSSPISLLGDSLTEMAAAGDSPHSSPSRSRSGMGQSHFRGLQHCRSALYSLLCRVWPEFDFTCCRLAGVHLVLPRHFAITQDKLLNGRVGSLVCFVVSFLDRLLTGVFALFLVLEPVVETASLREGEFAGSVKFCLMAARHHGRLALTP